MMHIFRAICAVALLSVGSAFAFDHQHGAWSALLRTRVIWLPGGHGSQVDYAGFKQDRAALKGYLDATSMVGANEFNGWDKDRRLAFLINAYNAYTVELILTRHPDLKSINDLGSALNTPWKKKFFALLGKERTLDDIEHGMIRAPGAYDDPRIHMAVNCASIGCPALRPEAYVGERLDTQLDDQVARFLSDRTRNRYNPDKRAVEVSKIFDWYRKDFSKGYRGIDSLESFLAANAPRLVDNAADQAAIRSQKVKIRFLEYDWTLNDRK